MKNFLGIRDVKALQILDSRGNPTIQVEVITEDGYVGKASVPSGASTGSFEAVELRDGDKSRYLGKGVEKAVENVNKKIAKAIIGMNVYEQRKIDEEMIKLDDTPNKSNLGANSILGVSLAVAKAASNSLGLDLYQYIGGINGKELPIPMMNILNGGKHSDNNISIQEFMIMPIGNITFTERMRRGVEIYHTLKKVLKEKGYSVGVGDEGGFAPNLENEEQALDIIIEAIRKAGYEPGKDIKLALDIASTEMYEEAKKINKQGYYFWKTKQYKTLKDIKIIDYFPAEIINNFDFAYVSEANIGTISATVDKSNNSITWTIPELASGETATVQYKLKLKENFDSSIVNKILNTNQKVDITYKDYDNKEQTKTSDISPKLKLTEPPTTLPKAGITTFIVTGSIVAISILIFSTAKLLIINRKMK